MRHTIIAIAVSLLLAFSIGCRTTDGGKPTPQAATFTTLKAAAAGIDAFRTTVEQARAAGTVSDAQWREFARAYNQANEAIIDAAKLLRDVGGMDAAVPESVAAAVQTLTDIFVRLVPPKR
jgi:hypothetical protein